MVYIKTNSDFKPHTIGNQLVYIGNELKIEPYRIGDQWCEYTWIGNEIRFEPLYSWEPTGVNRERTQICTLT